jgi:hypothetical protein
VGLIRKTLAVGTLGTVKPSSKKQRVAKATMKATQATAAAAQQQAQVALAAQRVEERRDADEREFRYATDPTYRKWVDDKRAAEEAERAAAAERAAEAVRLKRERSRRRWGYLPRVLVFVLLVQVFVYVAVFAWLPQLGISKARGKATSLVFRDRLTNAWQWALRRPNRSLSDEVALVNGAVEIDRK